MPRKSQKERKLGLLSDENASWDGLTSSLFPSSAVAKRISKNLNRRMGSLIENFDKEPYLIVKQLKGMTSLKNLTPVGGGVMVDRIGGKVFSFYGQTSPWHKTYTTSDAKKLIFAPAASSHKILLKNYSPAVFLKPHIDFDLSKDVFKINIFSFTKALMEVSIDSENYKTATLRFLKRLYPQQSLPDLDLEDPKPIHQQDPMLWVEVSALRGVCNQMETAFLNQPGFDFNTIGVCNELFVCRVIEEGYKLLEKNNTIPVPTKSNLINIKLEKIRQLVGEIVQVENYSPKVLTWLSTQKIPFSIKELLQELAKTPDLFLKHTVKEPYTVILQLSAYLAQFIKQSLYTDPSSPSILPQYQAVIEPFQKALLELYPALVFLYDKNAEKPGKILIPEELAYPLVNFHFFNLCAYMLKNADRFTANSASMGLFYKLHGIVFKEGQAFTPPPDFVDEHNIKHQKLFNYVYPLLIKLITVSQGVYMTTWQTASFNYTGAWSIRCLTLLAAAPIVTYSLNMEEEIIKSFTSKVQKEKLSKVPAINRNLKQSFNFWYLHPLYFIYEANSGANSAANSVKLNANNLTRVSFTYYYLIFDRLLKGLQLQKEYYEDINNTQYDLLTPLPFDPNEIPAYKEDPTFAISLTVRGHLFSHRNSCELHSDHNKLASDNQTYFDFIPFFFTVRGLDKIKDFEAFVELFTLYFLIALCNVNDQSDIDSGKYDLDDPGLKEKAKSAYKSGHLILLGSKGLPVFQANIVKDLYEKGEMSKVEALAILKTLTTQKKIMHSFVEISTYRVDFSSLPDDFDFSSQDTAGYGIARAFTAEELHLNPLSSFNTLLHGGGKPTFLQSNPLWP